MLEKLIGIYRETAVPRVRFKRSNERHFDTLSTEDIRKAVEKGIPQLRLEAEKKSRRMRAGSSLIDGIARPLFREELEV